MDESRVRELYELYKNGIYRYILSMIKDPYLAEDILQETFVRLIDRKFIPDPGKEQAWLYKVARNKCIDALRKQKKNEELTEIFVPEHDAHAEFFEII